MTTFVKAAKIGEIPTGRMKCVRLRGHRIALYNLGGEFFATQESCTHAEASLCEGDVSGDEVVCPLHFATFNIRTGACTGPPADEDLMTYAVRIVGDDIEVQVQRFSVVPAQAGIQTDVRLGSMSPDSRLRGNDAHHRAHIAAESRSAARFRLTFPDRALSFPHRDAPPDPSDDDVDDHARPGRGSSLLRGVGQGVLIPRLSGAAHDSANLHAQD